MTGRHAVLSVSYKGTVVTVKNLSKLTGITYDTLWKRLNSGMSPEMAVSKPIKGTRSERISNDGYVVKCKPRHKQLEHILIAEKALGKPLPNGAKVHHVNGIRSDNRHENLVICQDQAYHALLHVRDLAIRETGNPNYRKCEYCKSWSSQSELKSRKSRNYGFYHQACANKYARDRRLLLKNI